MLDMGLKHFGTEFRPNDGTMHFYGMVNAAAEPDMVYLDLGAGRAAWYEESPVHYRRKQRLMRGKVREVIAAEIDRLLKPGGWFCARTPHKLHYVALAASLMPERLEGWLLSKLQPGRKSKDVFPKVYRLNTLAQIRAAFPTYADSSFIYRSEPSYTFGSRAIYLLMDALHRITPVVLSGNIFVFMRKPESGPTK